MKTKISRILGVSLALVMVFSLFGVFAPVKEAQAAEGEMQWVVQPLPTGGAAGFWKLAAGTDVTEFAIGPDGKTIYAIDGNAALSAANAIFKSTDGGLSWLGLTAVPGVNASNVVTNVAVAPDNPNVVAVTNRARLVGQQDQICISTDGGVTWAILPNPGIGAGVAEFLQIMDLKVGPARTGTIYGRDYVIAASDNRAGAVAGNAGAGSSGLQIVGETATWTYILGAVGAGTVDFTSVELSPNFIGDRIVVAVGSTAAATNIYTYNVSNYSTALPALAHGLPPAPTAPGLTSIDYDGAGAAGQMIASDIALPINYAANTPGFERAWISTASGTAANDGVFRCDGTLAPRELGRAGILTQSIAYSGDANTGTLWAGDRARTTAISTDVWYTTQPQINLPQWLNSYKRPTGAGAVNGLAYVRVAPDKTVYVGTTGTESAFSASKDAGVSYDQWSLIDNGAATVVAIPAGSALALTPDGKTLFVSTRAGGNINLWKTTTPPYPTSWTRIHCVAGGTPARLAINRAGWATAPEVYLFDSTVAVNGLWASFDGGHVFSTPGYTLPAIGVTAAAVESSKTLYISIGANVFKSTNGGQVWTTAVPANVGAAVTSLVAAGGGVVIAGGAGLVSRSTDAGATFTQLTNAGLPANNLIALPDELHATNKLIYAGDQAVANYYRINAETGTIWENIGNRRITIAMGMSNGALYIMGDTLCARSINSRKEAAAVSFDRMDVPALVGAASFNVAQNLVYAANITTTLWAYNDLMATAVPDLTSPANGAVIPIDPVSGRADIITFAWKPMGGTSTGLAIDFQLKIYEMGAESTTAIDVRTNGTTHALVNWGASDAIKPAVTVGPTNSAAQVAANLIAGKTYQWKVRVRGQNNGEDVRSDYCDTRTFSIQAGTGIISPEQAGVVLQAPAAGSTVPVAKPGFAWAPVAGAVKYELEISTSAATKADGYFTTTVVSLIGDKALTTNAWTCDKDLANGVYVWHVKAITAGGAFVWGTNSFTVAIPVVTPPITIPPVQQITPGWIYAIIAVGAVLVIVVIILIVSVGKKV